MGISEEFSTGIGFRLEESFFDHLKTTVPEECTMEQRYDSKTGKPTHLEKIVTKHKREWWITSDGKKHDYIFSLYEYLSHALIDEDCKFYHKDFFGRTSREYDGKRYFLFINKN